MNIPNLMLKVIVMLHFVLSTWGDMSVLMPTSYLYVHIGVFACGLMAIVVPESTETILMMMATLGFSVIQDIILLSLYVPRSRDYIPPYYIARDVKEYRFALGMSILNLILKPFTLFILLRLFKLRNGEILSSFPGIHRIPGMGGMGNNSGHETMSNSSPASNSGVPVEPANPHSA